MINYVYEPSLNGERLQAALATQLSAPPYLIDSLVAERSILLVSADPGAGKSTIIANVIAQASAGLPVFGALHCRRPLRCYYIPFERGKEEIMGRFKCMESSIPLAHENIHIYDSKSCPIPNLLDFRDQQHLLASIARDCPNGLDLLLYDPIYGAVLGGLSNEERVSIFTRFNTHLVATFGCATWLAHHTVKRQMDREGVEIEREDPFYGSQFLKAHCTGSYYLKASPTKDGTVLKRKKDNWGILLPEIKLFYNPESYLSEIVEFESTAGIQDRLLAFYRINLKSDKTFTFDQIKGSVSGVSTSYLRRLLCTPLWTARFERQKINGHATLYKAIPEK